MNHELYTRVSLATDLPAHSLKRGDVATLVEFHPGSVDQDPGYTLEIFTATGETVVVVTVHESQIEELNSGKPIDPLTRF